MATPADLTAAMERAKADPHVQAAAKAWTDFHAQHGVWNPGHGTMGPQTEFQNAVQRYLPEGTYVVMDAQGQPVIKNQGMPSWVYPLIAGGAMFGGAALGGAFGASAPGALGAGEASTTLGATGGVVPGLSGAATAAGVGGATAAGTAAASGGSGIDKLLGGANGAAGGVDWAKLIAGLAATIPALAATRPTDEDRNLKATQQRILGIQEQRMNSQQPLFESTQRGLQALLPTFMRNGGQ